MNRNIDTYIGTITRENGQRLQTTQSTELTFSKTKKSKVSMLMIVFHSVILLHCWDYLQITDLWLNVMFCQEK